jgi:hypothetical protein
MGDITVRYGLYVCVVLVCYRCVLILLDVSSYSYMYMRPHTSVCVSSYYNVCVLILGHMLYMCPHTDITVKLASA